MTRSDLIIEVNRVLQNPSVDEQTKQLVNNMHMKIEKIYRCIFTMEDAANKSNDVVSQSFGEVAKVLRDSIES